MRSLIRGGWVVGFQAGEHRLIPNGEVAWQSDRILYAGPRFTGQAERVIEAPGKLVAPGFVNAHAVANIDLQTMMLDLPASPFRKPESYLQGGASAAFAGDELKTSAEFAIAGLLKGGSTTFAAVTTMAVNRWQAPVGEAETLAETAGRLGARAYISHNYRSGALYRDGDGVSRYAWDEAEGRAGLEQAVAFAEKYHGAFEGRVQATLFPYMADACSPELLAATRAEAERLDLRVRVHTAQYLAEFNAVLARHGCTPIEFLDRAGLLGPETIVTHALYTRAHPLSGFPAGDDGDLRLLAERGAHVAHCPVVFTRTGDALLSFSRYRRLGINVSLGTDAYPPDMIEEMRAAAWVCKVVDRDQAAGSTREVYDAATLGGARALGRDDLGRLAPGAKADIVIVDLNRFDLGPLDDPLQTLVQCASRRDVETVVVDGKIVVDGGRVVGIDEAELLARARGAYRGLKERVLARFWPGRAEVEVFPRALAEWQN
jgi:cytosine/adenosine deaminase-related metal-dependent hydrolase